MRKIIIKNPIVINGILRGEGEILFVEDSFKHKDIEEKEEKYIKKEKEEKDKRKKEKEIKNIKYKKEHGKVK